MAKDTNKNMIIGIAVGVVVLVALIVGIVIMSGRKGGDTSISSNDDTEYIADDLGEDYTDVDYSDVDVSVGFGDYDVMYAQAKAIQNGEMVGKIIQIDGIVSHPMSKYSVVEENEDGEKIGTEFVIEGLSEDEYPEDGDRIIITGEVIEKDPLYFVIKTTPKYVEVIGAVDGDEILEEDEGEEL